jgi:putative heme-binding domain-containing protein
MWRVMRGVIVGGGTALLVTGAAPVAAQTLASGTTGAALYATRCADCHGADATGVRGPDLTRLWGAGATDDRVFQTIRQGVPGSIMPASAAPDAEVRALVAYLKSIGTATPTVGARGSATAGEQTFWTTCGGCHRVNQRGGRLGPELTRIGVTQSGDALRQAIRHASAAITPGYQSVTLVTRDGTTVRGLRKAEDAFSVQLLDLRERLQGYLKAGLASVTKDSRSLMPDYGTDRLPDASLDDLITFLSTLKGSK